MAKIVKVGAVDLKELLKKKDKEERKEQEREQEKEKEVFLEDEALSEEDILDLAELEEGKETGEPISEADKDLFWVSTKAKARRDGYLYSGSEISWLVSKMTGYSVNVCKEIVFTALLILFSQLFWHKKVYIGGLCTIRFTGKITPFAKRNTATFYLKKTIAFYRFQKEFWGENLQNFWSKKPNSIEDIKRILKLLGLSGKRTLEKYCSVVDFNPLFEFLENKSRYYHAKAYLKKKEEIMKDPAKRKEWLEKREMLAKAWVERMIKARQKRKASIGQISNKGGQL